MSKTEIEKMYKLAKVKAINIAEHGSTYIPNSVKIDGELYPPFTAEKQLELIKWLAKIYEFKRADSKKFEEKYKLAKKGMYEWRRELLKKQKLYVDVNN